MEGMSLSGGEQRALRALSTTPARTWVCFTSAPDRYYFFQGMAPDRTWRLTELKRPPYGKTVHDIDSTTGAILERRAPRGLNPGPLVWGGLAVVVFPLALAVTSGMGILYPAVPILLLIALLGFAWASQYTPMYPDDAVHVAQLAEERARNAPSPEEAMRRQLQRQMEATRAAQDRSAQWQEAIWAQEKALNPDQPWAPGGHYPPPSSR